MSFILANHRINICNMGIINDLQVLKIKIKSAFIDLKWNVKRCFIPETIIHTAGNVPFSSNLCIFCSFSPNGIKNSTWQYLEDLKQNGFSIHLLSTTPLTENDMKKLKEICYKITEKENFGQDFGCYKISILEHYKKVENILLANDSVIGPLFPLKEVFDEMADKKCDFWGITDYIPFKEKINHHIASFFVLFRKNVIKSRNFLNFWGSYRPSSSRRKAIRLGEVKINKALRDAGFEFDSYVNSQKLFDLIENKSVNEIFNELLLEIHKDRLKPFKKRLNIESEEDKKTFILMQNKHKQNLMLIKYFRYPFIKKDIIQKDVIKEHFLIDFLEKNNFNISKEDILKELKKK